jgi:hypothetical protein
MPTSRPGIPRGDTVQSVRAFLLSLLFALELLALFAVLRWGYGDGGLDGAALGVLALVAMAALWGQLAAPRAPRRLAGWPLAAFMTVWFGVAVVALAAQGNPWLAVAFAAVVAATKGLLAVTGGNPSAPPAVEGQGPHVGQ